MKIKRHNLPVLTMFLALLIFLSGAACRAAVEIPGFFLAQSPTSTRLPATPKTSTPSATYLPTWTVTPSPQQTSPPELQPTQNPTASQVKSVGFQVRFHPDDAIYIGDRVSIEVIAPTDGDYKDARVQVSMRDGSLIGEAGFEHFGIAGRLQATLSWVWDTSSLQAGEYQLLFSLQPDKAAWYESINLLPAEALPDQFRKAAWAQASNECCVVDYVTGTAAERDLDSLLKQIDLQAQDVIGQMGIEFTDPITITLLPRLLGHGGFAGSEIFVSYLDRNYAASDPVMVIHHEMVHILDARLGGDFRPSMFVEGLAVNLTRGHFKPEPLLLRAAALLDSWGSPAQPGLGWYIPLKSLANDFYTIQHEVGYLQAGALVEFMLDEYGWDSFMEFYRGIEPNSEGPAAAIDSSLKKHLGLSLADLEENFLNALRNLPANPVLLTDVRLTVQFYDAVRYYQQINDPSAYFLTAWLVDTERMRQEGIVADYLRHPNGIPNYALEVMLAAAGENIRQEDYTAAELTINAVEAVLKAQEAGWSDPFAASLVAAEYLQISNTVIENPGWVGADVGVHIELQRIWLQDSQARVLLTAGDAQLLEVILRRDELGSWQFLDPGAVNEEKTPIENQLGGRLNRFSTSWLIRGRSIPVR